MACFIFNKIKIHIIFVAYQVAEMVSRPVGLASHCSELLGFPRSLTFYPFSRIRDNYRTRTMSVRYYRIRFLGHHVSAAGISPLASAVDAIVNFVRPKKQRALRRYLGMINYYHRFIPNCANKLTSLNQLLTAANEGHTRLTRYLLTCVDRFTPWPEAIPLVYIRAEMVADAFFSGWIARFATLSPQTPPLSPQIGAPSSNQNYGMVYVTSSG